MYLQFRNAPGDVYVLNSEKILIYGIGGIALTLGSRNLENLQQTSEVRQVKDEDRRGTKFTASYNSQKGHFRLDITKGPVVFVSANDLIEKLEKFQKTG